VGWACDNENCDARRAPLSPDGQLVENRAFVSGDKGWKDLAVQVEGVVVQGSTARNDAVDVLRIIGSLRDALYSIDAVSGEYDFVSAGFESLTGYTLDDIRRMGGRASFDTLTHVDPPENLVVTSPIKRDGQRDAGTHERWLRRKDGSVVCLEDRSGPVRDGDRIIGYAGVLRDITDRMMRDAEIRRRNTLLRTVVDCLPDAVYAKDVHGRKLLSNPADVRTILYCNSEEEVLGKDDFAFFPHDLAAAFTAVDQQVILSGEPVINREESIIDQAGAKRWLLSTKVPFRDTQGTIIGLVGIGRDITDRRKAEEALKLFRALIDHSSDSIIVIDPASMHLIDANETALRVFGYTREEMLSISIFDLSPSTTPEMQSDISDDLLKHGSAILKRQQRRKDGSTYPSEVSINLVHLDRDYVVASIRDLSRRAAAEAALQRSEERFRLVLENVSDQLTILDPSGRCEFASPSHMHDDVPPESLIEQDYLSYIHPEDVDRLKECLAFVVKGHGHQSIEYRFRRGDGFWRFKDASVTLIVDDCGPRILTVARDVTERKLQDEERRWLELELSERNIRLEKTIAEVRQMQQGLIQSEKMASIGQLTAGIAHEINNPLAFVSSNLNRFGEYFNDVLGVLREWQCVKDELQKYPPFDPLLAKIRKTEEAADLEFAIENFSLLMKHTNDGTERIKSIVDRLRGFSHMSTGSYTEADINAAIDDTINLTWNELKYKATIVKEYGDLPPVTCNIGEIKQVLVNLIVNAAQALQESGTITIRTTHKDSTVVIQVIDTGSGIAETHLKRIFDPFFTTKAVGKGTGLGLWISATIVQKHAGTLTVESQPGTGTTMTIALPISQQNVPEEGE
jgi:two-component system, NtrC family, sensor kinase